MEIIKVEQWAVTVDAKTLHVFTPVTCDQDTAMAIAVATFGKGVSAVEDEGSTRVQLAQTQMVTCLDCGDPVAYGTPCKRCGLGEVE